VLGLFFEFVSFKNDKCGYNSTTIEAREKVGTDIKKHPKFIGAL
jgi:hypothetical protein